MKDQTSTPNTTTIERYSPDWIRMIPRWLARGIWDAIEDELDGGEHAGTRERNRRKSQILGGILNDSNRGVVMVLPTAISDSDQRRSDRRKSRSQHDINLE